MQGKTQLISNVYIEISPEGFCTRANQSVFENLGYQAQELLGKKFKDFLQIDSQKLHEIETGISSGDGIILNFEAAFRHKLGKPVFLLWTIYWSVEQDSVICIGKPLNQNEQKFIKENHELQLLNAINECIQQNHEPEEIFDSICKIMVKTGRYQLAFVGKQNPAYLEIWFKESEAYLSDEQFNKSPLISHLFDRLEAGFAMNEAGIIHFSEDEMEQFLPKGNFKIRSLVLSPVNLGEEKQWLFCVASINPEGFDSHESGIIEKIRANLTYALRSIQIEKKNETNESHLSKYIHELTLLNEVNNLILHTKDEETLIKQILNVLVQKGGYRLSWLAYFEKNKEREVPIVPCLFAGETEYAANLSFDLTDSKILAGPSATCILTQKTIVQNSTLDDPNYSTWREQARKFGLQSSISIYLDLEGSQKATLSIYAAQKNGFDHRETIILERLVQNISYAISSIRTNEKSKEVVNELSISKKLIIDYRKAINQIAIISSTDAEGVITSINENFITEFGYGENEILGQKHTLINSGFHTEEFWKNFWDTILQGNVWVGEIKNKNREGIEKWYDTTIYPFMDMDGKPYQFISFRWDTTLKRSAEENATIMTRLVESSEEAIYSVDLNGDFTSWNDASTKLYGYEREEIIGKNIANFLRDEKLNEEKEIIEKIKRSESIIDFETDRITKHGKTIYLSLSISPLRDNQSKIIGYSKIARDISRLKLAEITAKAADDERNIKEREIGLLKDLSKLMQEEGISVHQFLLNSAKLIPSGWKYSKDASVCIYYKNRNYHSSNFEESKTYLKGSSTNSKKNGIELTVYYPEQFEILPEEQSLINLICNWLNVFLTSLENEIELVKKVRELKLLEKVAIVFTNTQQAVPSLLEKTCTLLSNEWLLNQSLGIEICLGNDTYVSGNIESFVSSQTSNFETMDGKSGSVKVYFPNELIESYDMEVLNDNQLLYSIAHQLTFFVNKRILKNRLDFADTRLNNIINHGNIGFLLFSENLEIIYSNKQNTEVGRNLFNLDFSPGMNLNTLAYPEITSQFLNMVAMLKNQNECKFNIENTDIQGNSHLFELNLIKTINPENKLAEILLVTNDITHIKQKEKDVSNLINLLKDLNFITSYEISHEFHKLQAIVELAQDLDFEDSELKEIFKTSKETFNKAGGAIKKLIERINIPLQEELLLANSYKQIEKVILVDDDEISNKISMRMLGKFFSPVQLISFTSIDDSIAYLKSKGDTGKDLILLEINIVAKSGWEFIKQYESNGFLSPLLIMGSNLNPEIQKKIHQFEFIKNYIQKPVNKETAEKIFSKEAFAWNN